MRSPFPLASALSPSGVLLLLFAVPSPSGSQAPATRAVDLELAAVTEEAYTVGTFSGQEWETFGRIADVDFDADGNLYILDEGNYRVVVLDRDGAPVRMIGSQGEGPGEFSAPTRAAILEDGRLVVYDMGFPALKVFDPTGGFVGSTTVNPMQGGMPGEPLLPLGAGRLVTTGGMKLGTSSQNGAEAATGDDHLRDIDIFRLDGSGVEVLYRAWDLPPGETVEEFTATNAAGQKEFTLGFPRRRAFQPALHLGVLPDGRVAVVDSVGYRVKLIGQDGRVTGVIERNVAPVPVTEAIEEAERARQIEVLTDPANSTIRLFGGSETLSGEAAEQLREQILSMIENMLFPEEIPVVAGMAVDGEGRLWIARTAPDGIGDGPIDIMTPEGHYVGTLSPGPPRIPDAFGPDGLMAYIETDGMGVPSVRVIRLVSLEP
ncbi:MAG: 6-bladed beta-propeller [Gemmatimonadota bacterium]|nr:6-bladed beta-propeller [Gemmatimonadota bacterium]MDE2864350.1 6-bladed beta-propeller [Gemmatimonadota bacterium]